MTATEVMPLAFVGGSLIAALTWFLSYRPRLFVRAFVPRNEWRGGVRAFLQDERFGRSMRLMALLQFGVAAICGVIGLWLWLG